jgi:AraC family transcriptional regulator, transcriptional activator FtrA
MHKVAIAITSGLPMFELAAPMEVFGGFRKDFPVPWWYELQLCGIGEGPVRTAEGFMFDGALGLEDLVRADTVIIPACADWQDEPSPTLLAALREAYARGARIASICTGAFTLAAAGLLDGRRATTHWMHAEELARRWPAVQVEANVLYTDEGQILTSAGSAAGLDLCLHMVQRDHGTRVANGLARRIVVAPHREGGQAQFIEQPVSPDGDASLGPLIDWARKNLQKPLTVETLAAKANMSPRTFARKFRDTTGTTPMQWLSAERVRFAQDLLENTDQSIDHVASLSGLGSAQVLRTHFTRINQVTPHEFRRTFRANANS